MAQTGCCQFCHFYLCLVRELKGLIGEWILGIVPSISAPPKPLFKLLCFLRKSPTDICELPYIPPTVCFYYC